MTSWDEQAFRRDARAHLREVRSATPAELERHLAGAGHDTAGDPDLVRRILLDEWTDTDEPAEFSAFPLADERLVDLEHVLAGVVLTAPLARVDRRRGALPVTIDLDLLSMLADDRQRIRLTAGGVLEDRGEELRGPAGWLPDAPAVALTVGHDATLSVRGLEELPLPDPALAGALRDTYERWWGGADSMLPEPWELLLQFIADDPSAFSEPAAPVNELLVAAGLEDSDGFVIREGEEPARPQGGRLEDDGDDLVEHLELDHGFDAATIRDVLLVANATARLGSEALREVVRALSDPDADGEARAGVPEADELLPTSVPDLDEETAAALGRLIATPDASYALLHDVVGSDHLAAASLLAIIDSVDADLDRKGRANRHWLRAQLLEFVADDHADAEEELRRAVELDPHHGAAAFALAGYRSDRGDARGALELIRSFELHNEDHEWVALLERYARPRQAAAGRNDPCPCGSGKKYKRCCADRVGWSLEERRDWLMDKVMRFATSPANLEEAAVLAEAAYLDGDVADILEDDFLTTLLMFDAGTIADLVEVRGSLLPADEREFLARWGSTMVSAYEVVDIDADAGGLALLDHRDGERIEVTDGAMSSSLSAGDLLLGWFAPGPTGELEPVHGGILVPPHARLSAIELISGDPDAGDVADWYARLIGPPTLVDAAGDPLEFVGSTYEVADVDAATTAVRAVFEVEREEDGAIVFDHLAGADDAGHRSVLGAVTVHPDGRVTTFAVSARKSDALRERVVEALPDAVFVESVRRPAEEVLRSAGGGAARELDDVAAAYLHDYEDRWVDMEVPALGGLTPRQAVDDPTRRDDLERLLRDFEARGERQGQGGQGATMDVARIRSLLGL